MFTYRGTEFVLSINLDLRQSFAYLVVIGCILPDAYSDMMLYSCIFKAKA